jgi:hypothetical protein
MGGTVMGGTVAGGMGASGRASGGTIPGGAVAGGTLAGGTVARAAGGIGNPDDVIVCEPDGSAGLGGPVISASACGAAAPMGAPQ